MITQAGNTLYEKLSSCGICPRGCRVNRLEGQECFCRTDSQPEVSVYEPHFGEEACLVGEKGSGAIFFTLELLEGTVDIYVPDFKVWNRDVAARIIGARDYPEVAREAIKEMHCQVGDLVLDQNGLARRGLLVRHLVLPEDLSGTEKVCEFIVNEISKDTYLNLMGHYHPCGLAQQDYPPLDRTLYKSEFRRALEICERLGLKRLDRTHYRILDLILRDAL